MSGFEEKFLWGGRKRKEVSRMIKNEMYLKERRSCIQRK